jgi:hypothetical protein
MVSNIGHDGTGLHCGKTDIFSVQLANQPITYFESNLVENALALNKTKSFFSPQSRSFFFRVFRILRKRFSGK